MRCAEAMNVNFAFVDRPNPAHVHQGLLEVQEVAFTIDVNTAIQTKCVAITVAFVAMALGDEQPMLCAYR